MELPRVESESSRTTGEPTTSPRGRGSPRRVIAACLVLAALVVWAFLPAVDNDFVGFDDVDYVTGNYRVQQGLSWDGVKWAFTTTSAANWHPLTWLSIMLDCQMYGLTASGHHLTSILLHALSTVLLFLALRSLTDSMWTSLVIAALFGLHPLRVESVAWASERKDVLSGVFWMLTLLAYAYFAHASKAKSPGSKFWYGVTLLTFALGLLAKPMLVTLPFVLLLLDYWPLQRMSLESRVLSLGFRKANWPFIREKIPFFVLTLASCLVTFLVQNRAGTVDQVMPLTQRIENAAVAYVRYLGKLFWPVDLAFFYPHPQDWPLPMVLLALVILSLISVCALKLWRRWPFLLVGWLWFLGTLIPVIGLVQVGKQSLADRYTYLPSIGILIVVIWSATLLVSRLRRSKLPLISGGIVTIAACVFLTRGQTRTWKNPETLARHAIAVTADNYVAHDMLGAALDKQGRTEEALEQHRTAIEINPNYADAHNNLAVVLQRQGRLAEAIAHYQKALTLRPRYPEAWFNLGVAEAEAGRLDAAVEYYSRALSLRPEYPDASYNRGLAFARMGRLQEALAEFQRTLQFAPNDAKTLNNMGVTLDQLGRFDEAKLFYERTLQLQPENARVHFNLGVLLTKQREYDQAILRFQEALRLKPDYFQAQSNLSSLLRLKSRE